jgi:hypothetical protein
VRPNFTSTLDELVKKTQACIDQSVGLVWAVTQQQSVDVKIDAVVESVTSTVISVTIVLMFVKDWQAK